MSRTILHNSLFLLTYFFGMQTSSSILHPSSFIPHPSSHRQSEEEHRLNDLRKLCYALKASDSLRNEDVTVILNEETVIEVARQIVGLEIVMANGGLLRVTSLDGQLKPAAAIVKIGVQAKTSIAVNLLLTGSLGAAEIKENALQIPFRITDISLTYNPASSLFLKKILGDWVSPDKWNEELPPLEIPLEIAGAMEIPAGKINVDSSPPMEISTPLYRSPLNLAIRSFFVLEKRLVLGLHLVDRSGGTANSDPPKETSMSGLNNQDQASLEAEAARLSERLISRDDIRLTIHRRVISKLLEQIAAAYSVDFNIQLKPGRIRSVEVDAGLKIQNYTDVESGEGQADLNYLNIDGIADGNINLRVSGQGEIHSRLRGREFGVPYRLSPNTVFTIKDRIVPLQFVAEGERFMMRAMPGSTLPISLRFSMKVAGRDLGVTREITVGMEKWLNGIGMPSFLGREFSLPRRLELDAGGNLSVVKKERLLLTLSKMRVIANEDAVEMTADVAFTQP
ncbi:MAG: hypothetical protein L0220_05980 [Acidobacteria bacterium]|nr:hypothetical protein [Acidobacteriota bacterium]